MTAITDILAEAFNRVKTEHGVTLSRVRFEHYSGNLAGVEFTSTGSVYQNVASMPPQLQPVTVAPCPPKTPIPIFDQRGTQVGTKPHDATHFGSISPYDDCYWLLIKDDLYVWDSLTTWTMHTTGGTVQSIVGKLTPLANPTSLSSSGSGS